jgi:trigger factor
VVRGVLSINGRNTGMKITSNQLENLRAELTVVIPAEEVEKRFKDNLETAIKDINVPGFRKGKAPKNLLEKQVDQDKLWEITRNEIVDDTLTEALTQENIRALNTEEVHQEAHEPGSDFTYHAKVRLLPQIPDIKYEDIVIKIHKNEITEDQIDKTIENLRINWAEGEPITDRPLKDGDWVLFTLEGNKLSRIQIPGQSDEKKKMFPTSQLSSQIGGERSIPWLDKHVAGMKVKESKTVHVTMPKDFINPPLEQDTEIEAIIRVMWAETKVIPPLTEEYLVEKNIAKDIPDLRKKVRAELEIQVKQIENQEAVNHLHDWLIENVKFTLPEDIIEQKKDEIIDRLRLEYNQRGENFDLVLKRVDEQAADLRKEIDRQAEELSRLDFIIPHIGEKEELTVDQSEMLNHMQMVAHQTQLKKHQIKQLMEDQDFLIHSYKTILSRKVTNFLLNHSTKEYIVDEEEEPKTSSIINPQPEEKKDSGLIITG